MNFLAHFALSPPDPEIRAGNLIGDWVKGTRFDGFPLAVVEGIRLHRRIDRLTDEHSAARRAAARFAPEWRRFGGVLADVVNDHFLSLHWEAFHAQPLEDAVAEFAGGCQPLLERLPEKQRNSLTNFLANDVLLSYRRLTGVEEALRRVEQRLARRGRAIDLQGAMARIRSEFSTLEADFLELFPALHREVFSEP